MIAFGASAIHPYMLFQTVAQIERRKDPEVDLAPILKKVRKAGQRRTAQDHVQEWGSPPSPATGIYALRRDRDWGEEITGRSGVFPPKGPNWCPSPSKGDSGCKTPGVFGRKGNSKGAISTKKRGAKERPRERGDPGGFFPRGENRGGGLKKNLWRGGGGVYRRFWPPGGGWRPHKGGPQHGGKKGGNRGSKKRLWKGGGKKIRGV